MSSSIYRPGQIVPVSGQYAVVTATGRHVGREATCVKGNRFEPVYAHRGEHGYVLVDRTIHRW